MSAVTSPTSILHRIDVNTREAINYLKNHEDISDLLIEEISGASKIEINEWEIKNVCTLPDDLKAFYMNHNGLLIEWKFKIDKTTALPWGKIRVNSLKNLTRVGTVLSRDFNEPSIFDLEDLQSSPSTPKTSNFSFLNEFEMHETDHSQKYLLPSFDETLNFELDNCRGYGKICLVYLNRHSEESKKEPGDSAQVWYLDRDLTWHFLANSFTNYYRLLIGHLGLPQWPTLFTPDGLPPYLKQWLYLFASGRILIQQPFEHLKIIEINSVASKACNNKPTKNHQSDTQHSTSDDSTEPKSKINFALFDDAQSKGFKYFPPTATSNDRSKTSDNSNRFKELKK